MAGRLAAVFGLVAVAAVSSGPLAFIFFDAGTVGSALVLIGFLGGIAGMSLAVVALDRQPDRRWQARLGFGLSAVALFLSVAVVAGLVILILAIIAGARQGG